MVKFIINADDLGLNQTVNNAIELAMEHNRISSATIMANTEYPQEVFLIYKKFKTSKSFGVHLNITEGRCLTKNKILHSAGLVDEENNFTNSAHKVNYWSEELKAAIYEEWKEQILKVKKMGVDISHLDGHHHVHAIFALEPVLLMLCNEFHITKVRSAYIVPFDWKIKRKLNFRNNKNKAVIPQKNVRLESSNEKEKKSGKIAKLLAYIEGIYKVKKWRSRMKSHNIVLSDIFDSYLRIFNYIESDCVFSDDEIVELMCHPGHPNGKGYPYEDETKLVMNEEIYKYVNSSELISYNQL